jgi:peptidyl-prolyl cis-trans isomerase A (cyclophilin A)
MLLAAFALIGCGEKHAPDHFFTRLETSKGVVVFEIRRELAPARVDRFYSLVTTGFYDNTRFYCVEPAGVRFGISGNPEANLTWQDKPLAFEPVKEP